MNNSAATPPSPWRYPIEACDVPMVRHGRLEAYREFRSECLDCLHRSELSVSKQLIALAYYTTIFRTLNESSERHVNHILWQLAGANYASLLAAGIRRMIDRDSRTISLWWVLDQLENRPELLTRELYVCHDGLPFDWERARTEWTAARSEGSSETSTDWIRAPIRGRNAWGDSRRMHDAFDEVMGTVPALGKRRRLDVMSIGVISRLKAELQAPSIDRLHTWADRRMLHAERLAHGEAVATPRFEDVTDAIHRAARVLQFVSTHIFWDTHISNVVPSMNFNWARELTIPWATADQIPSIKADWKKFSQELDQAMDGDGKEFLPARPTTDGSMS